jgi:hypothetical protein
MANTNPSGGRPSIQSSHHEAIDRLGFVHERLPSGNSHNGYWFTPRDDFDTGRTMIRVEIDDDGTELTVLDEHGQYVYSVDFAYNTPMSVVNQAVSAAVATLVRSL